MATVKDAVKESKPRTAKGSESNQDRPRIAHILPYAYLNKAKWFTHGHNKKEKDRVEQIRMPHLPVLPLYHM